MQRTNVYKCSLGMEDGDFEVLIIIIQQDIAEMCLTIGYCGKNVKMKRNL